MKRTARLATLVSTLALALLVAVAAYAGITTNCFNWSACPEGNSCCERVDTGVFEMRCKQLCDPYSDKGCCKYKATRVEYRPLGTGCCETVNNGNPVCWIISDADNLGLASRCEYSFWPDPAPCNTDVKGSCVSITPPSGGG